MFEVVWVVATVLMTVPFTMAIPACSQNEDVCKFTLVIEAKLTMMWGKELTYPHNGSLYKYDVVNPANATPVPTEEVIQADGWESPRLVLVFNGSLPGPAIEVYEHQTVMVHVINKLHNDGVTVHWHGVHQVGTPFMDGVAFVSQCPILPGKKFTYLFEASPKGTLWYHSHMGSQRTMGLYGPLIVHERHPTEPKYEEFIWTVSDWNHEYDSEVGFYKMVYGIYEGRTKYQGTRSLDGSFFSWFQYHSGLLNGRGRFYDPQTGTHNDAPLTSFTVVQGRMYRVRLINAGGLFPFRISIDGHLISVIASDGYYLEPVLAQSIIINPGERFDFIIVANQSVGNYWIRGVTLEAGYNHTLEGILHYEGASDYGDPVTHRHNCTSSQPCVVVNCPFSSYPKEKNTVCVSFDELKSSDVVDTPLAEKDSFEEKFLNFAFPGYRWTPGSINGRAFEQPTVTAISDKKVTDTSCQMEECGEEKVCKCTWALHLTHGKTYQFVFLNMGKGKGWSHPIHMHGHSFYVLKMGYGRYDQITGMQIGDNLDVNCRGNADRQKSFCNNATWQDPAWLNGNVPGIEISRPPRKDTLIVPTGGYAVVRIRADNPGLWMMHCHIQTHNLDGMAMILNESFSQISELHGKFPPCSAYEYFNDDEVNELDQVDTGENSGATVTSLCTGKSTILVYEIDKGVKREVLGLWSIVGEIF